MNELDVSRKSTQNRMNLTFTIAVEVVFLMNSFVIIGECRIIMDFGGTGGDIIWS